MLRTQNRLALMPPIDGSLRTIEDVVRQRQWVREAEKRGAISHEAAAALHRIVDAAQDNLRNVTA